jgi:hypothetical protein
MIDLRENLGWIIGSVVAGIVAFLGWFYESGLLSTFIGIFVGAGIAYFVQTRTQKRAWKREYGVKIAEQVYGTLFRDTKSLIRSLENKYYFWIGFEGWKQIQEDHRYFMVDEQFRERLDQFSDRAEKYSSATRKLRDEILPKVAIAEAERVFETKLDEKPRFNVNYMTGHKRISTSPDLVQCLISETHPLDYATRNESEVSGLECTFEVKPIDGQPIHSHDSTQIDDVWKSCLARMKQDETYRFVIEENQKLLEEARQVKKEIIKRIEEPWKI